MYKKDNNTNSILRCVLYVSSIAEEFDNIFVDLRLDVNNVFLNGLAQQLMIIYCKTDNIKSDVNYVKNKLLNMCTLLNIGVIPHDKETCEVDTKLMNNLKIFTFDSNIMWNMSYKFKSQDNNYLGIVLKL